MTLRECVRGLLSCVEAVKRQETKLDFQTHELAFLLPHAKKGVRYMSFRTAARVQLLILSMAILPGFMVLPPLKAEDQRITRALVCMDFMLYDEAISLFEQALQNHPMEHGLRVKQAYAYFRLNKYKEAVGALNREHELFQDDLKPLILLCFIQHVAGQPDNAGITARAAQAKLDKILNMSNRKKVDAILRDLFPNAGLPAYLLGLEASKKQNSRTARSCFLRAQALSYDGTDCWLQAINAEMEAGNWSEALRLCATKGDISLVEQEIGGISAAVERASAPPKQKSIVADMPADVLMLKAISLAQLGRQDEYRASLEEAVAAEPFRTDLLKNVAIDTMRRANFERAAQVLTKVLKLTPLDFQARFLLEQAQAHRSLADGSVASAFSRDFMKARGPRFLYVLESRPYDAAAAANGYALNFIQRGLLVDAARHLRAFTEIYENSPTIYYDLGQLDNTLGLFAEALACGAKALKLKNDYTEAYDLMGNVYFKVGDFENAVHSYESSLQLNSHDPLSFFNLACAVHELGDDANAEKNWLEAVRLENAAATAGAQFRANADALEHFLTIEVEPVSALSCQYLGLLYAGQGKTEQAIEYFEKAIAFNPNGLIPYLEIGRLYKERNEPDRAGEYFKKYLDLGGDENKVRALSKKGNEDR
jgi:tetratricopeptide (TPR) repeat protein